jgi:hypothetical protein
MKVEGHGFVTHDLTAKPSVEILTRDHHGINGKSSKTLIVDCDFPLVLSKFSSFNMIYSFHRFLFIYCLLFII